MTIRINATSIATINMPAVARTVSLHARPVYGPDTDFSIRDLGARNGTFSGDLGAGNGMFSGDVSVTGHLDIGEYIQQTHANALDDNDGKIGADLFHEGLNIVGVQTVPGNGRLTTVFGNLHVRNGGVYLGGSGAANFLDEYEEGTFAPYLSELNENMWLTYTLRVGRYTKIGRLVFIEAEIHWNGKGGGNNNIYLKGLPFVANSAVTAGAGTGSYCLGFPTNVLVYPNANSTFVNLVKAGTALTRISHADVSTSGIVRIGLVYTTN